jgi:acid phosphatase class B
MTPSPSAPRTPAPRIDDRYDVEQIRLWNARNAMALLAEFQCAERVLAKWGSTSVPSQVSFEIRFVDGHVLRGSHEFFRNGRRRCLLATHVRRLMNSSTFCKDQPCT